MPSLITDLQKTYVTGVFGNVFDTFSRPIIIYKEGIKTPVPTLPNNTAIFGFGQNQSQQLFSFTPVTGIYPAIIKYAGRYGSEEKEDILNSNIDAYFGNGPISIKIRGDTKDFIINGHTEKIQIDGVMCILDSKEYRPQFLWGSQFYIFDLQIIK
jgi:hypothetical protein